MENETLNKENVDPSSNQAPLNVWQRLAGVLTNPRQTFADITAHPHFAAGLVILCAVNLLIGLSILPKVRAFPGRPAAGYLKPVFN
ncbi:MAG: hypothetical protein AB1652_02010 [Bacillota bacterium]